MRKLTEHKVYFRLIAFVVGLVAVLVTMRSILGPSFFRPHDFTHAARLVEMQRSLASREFPVRWSRNFGFGYSMPLFNFYAPLPYYIGQLPLLLGSSSVDAIKFLYILNGALAFVGMYLLGRQLWGKWGGLLSAVVFSFSSYRALDLFVRGAMGEAFALVFLPFVLYGVLVGREKPKKGILITGFSLALVLLSHNLTGMITLALVCVFSLLLRVRLRNLILAILLGIGLSAFYVLPAFMEKGLTRVDQTITVGYFDYHNHLLCFSQLFKGQWKYGASLPGCSDDLSFDFGRWSWVLFIFGVGGLAWAGKRREKTMGLVLTAGLVVSAFMTIGRSVFIWDHIGVLKYFQFPWRFLTFSHVFFAAIVGSCVLLVRKQRWLSLPLLILVSLMVYSQSRFYLPEKSLSASESSQFYETSPEWIRKDISKTLNDYLPPAVKDDGFPNPVSERLMANDGSSVKIEQDRSDYVSGIATCISHCVVRVNIFQYPGWKARIDGQPQEMMPMEGDLPIYSMPVSTGSHKIEVYYTGTPTQVFGNLVSLLTIMGIMILCVPKKYSIKI